MLKRHEEPVMVTRSSLPPLEEYVEMLNPTIHICNAVGRQIGHFYFYLVISRFQPFAYFQLIRYGPLVEW